MIKIYEAIRKNSARMVTTYLGVTITLNFENGNIYSGVNAYLKTNDKFIQDAIENDSRFGVTIRLKQKIEEESDKVADEAQSADNNEAGTAKRAKVKKTSDATNSDANAEVVKTVKNINDAIDYFAEKGILVDDASQISDLCAKHNVSFPNLK